MAEYIEREAFLESKRKLYCEDCDRRKGMKNGKYRILYDIGDVPCRVCGIEDVLSDVEDFPSEDVQPVKWIPVTERLPEEYEDVLCYYEYFRYGDFNCIFRAIDRGYYGDGIWGGEAGQGHKNKVLAWMPLPEPPKDGET